MVARGHRAYQGIKVTRALVIKVVRAGKVYRATLGTMELKGTKVGRVTKVLPVQMGSKVIRVLPALKEIRVNRVIRV